MTIGIFGESFTSFRKNDENTATSWIYNLDAEITVYARGGASLLWVYMQFIENYEKHDTIIFVVPPARRADHFGVISSYKDAQYILSKSSLSQEEYDKAKLFADYYTHIQNDEVDNLYGALIIESVRRHRPNTIFIPISKYLKFFYDKSDKVTTFDDFMYLQTRSLFPNYANQHEFNIWLEGYTDKNTTNHFTPEINQLVANYVKRALAGEGWQDWGIDKIPSIPHSKPWDYFFEKS
jgi:hypothetical protein